MTKYNYKTILKHIEHEIPKIKWSRFIGNIFHIKDKQEAEKYIKEINEKHKWANHNCFAYTYGTNINFDLFGNLEITPEYFRQSDEWEPANTAGKPILAQIQWQNLHNILIIVTRYFGWTLLWIWWLIQAYGECAKQTILNANIVNIEITEQITLNFEYKLLPTIMKLINNYDVKIIEETHWEEAKITLEINKWIIDEFKKDVFDQTKWQLSI